MPRAIRILSAAERNDANAADTLILPFAQRISAHAVVFGVKGTCVELDLPEPLLMRTDDFLELDDGRFVQVVSEPEPVVEVRAHQPDALARIAWYLGNRHVPIEFKPNRLRIRRDPTTEKLVQWLGARITVIEAPFEPENTTAGANDHAGHEHSHHDHAHHLHHHHHHHAQDHDDHHHRERD